jgi:hypothetical protein
MDLKLKGKTALVTGGSEGIDKGTIGFRRKEPLAGASVNLSMNGSTRWKMRTS